MYEIRKAIPAIVPTVVVVVWLAVVFGCGAEPPHQQRVQDSHVKQGSTVPPDEVEKVRHVLNAANECLRSIASPRLELLLEMAVAQSRAGEAAKSGEMFGPALKVASNIRDARENYRALLGIAVSQAKVGKVDAAVHTAELATSPKYRVGILGLVAHTLSSRGDVQDALTVAKLIPEAYGWERSMAVCNVAWDMAHRGDCSQALTVLKEIKPDMAHAHKLHLRQQAGADLAPAEQAIVTEAVWKAAALKNVALCHARAGRFVEATKVAETIGFGCFPDRALRNTASIAADAGNLQAARRIASQIRDEEEKDLALGDVAVGEAAKGLRDHSSKTVAAITCAEVKGETMMRIAVVLAQSGEHAEAEKMFAAAEKEQLDPEARIAAELKIAQALAEHREFTSADKIAERLPNQAARARIMAAIGSAYGKTGDTADAQRSFQRAYECALRIADLYERTKVLREVAASQIAAEDHSGAERTLKEAARIATTIPAAAGTKFNALQEIAVAQAKSGDQPAARATFELAMNAAKAYEDEEYAARLSQDVMQAQTECGDSQTALECANKVASNVIKCRCLLGIALGLLRHREEAQ